MPAFIERRSWSKLGQVSQRTYNQKASAAEYEAQHVKVASFQRGLDSSKEEQISVLTHDDVSGLNDGPFGASAKVEDDEDGASD